jgi:S1-C subfamily serine protease
MDIDSSGIVTNNHVVKEQVYYRHWITANPTADTNSVATDAVNDLSVTNARTYRH